MEHVTWRCGNCTGPKQGLAKVASKDLLSNTDSRISGLANTSTAGYLCCCAPEALEPLVVVLDGAALPLEGDPVLLASRALDPARVALVGLDPDPARNDYTALSQTTRVGRRVDMALACILPCNCLWAT